MASQVRVLNGKRVKIYSDNTHVHSILQSGSKKEDLHLVTSDIFQSCEKNNISIEPEWIPRNDNYQADFISRCEDCDDWSISKTWFKYFDKVWGKYEIDRFVSSYNKQYKRLNSRFWIPGTECIDALSQS